METEMFSAFFSLSNLINWGNRDIDENILALIPMIVLIVIDKVTYCK